MTDNPKVMFNQGEGKFTAMDPKDDNLVNKIYNSKDPVKEVDKLVNETKPASSVAEYYKQQSEIKKFNSLDRSTYPSDPKQRNRLKAMSTWDAMKEVAKEEARKGNYKDLRELRKIERNAMKKKKGPFEQSLDNVINKPKKIITLPPLFMKIFSVLTSGLSFGIKKYIIAAGMTQLITEGIKMLKNVKNSTIPACQTIKVVMSPKGL